jgi:hypothetical protein
MKRFHVHLLAVPALLAFSTLGQGIEYTPREGLVLTKHLTQSDETQLDEISVSVNGQEQDPDMVAMDQSISSSLEVILIDEYGPLTDGRPARLKRTYDTITSGTTMEMSHPMMGDQTMTMTGESELEGEVVLFTWSADDGDYKVKFAEDAGSDEDLLEGLTEDTDLRGLLPTSEVEEGATWEVDPSELRPVFAFGGALKLEMDGGDAEAMGGMGTNDMPNPSDFIKDLDGTVTAEFTGTRDEGGRNVAVIQLVISVNTANDMTEFFREAMEKSTEEMGMDMEVNGFDIEFEFEGEALLLWDVAGGHLHSFEMNGETSMAMDMAMGMDMGGESMDFETSMLMVGNQSTLIEVEAAAE